MLFLQHSCCSRIRGALIGSGRIRPNIRRPIYQPLRLRNLVYQHRALGCHAHWSVQRPPPATAPRVAEPGPEIPFNEEFQGPLHQQVGMILWFAFSTLTFSQSKS
ncbi:hypothetical protein SASPL_106820 [Salvia splendens]|uniref:Uncharacterized protein n=1 Tax=Salvia splendens TaxID=180675 RepID=A0A8X8YA87_SALSN|nr:hypothetical protein SASPL_106820 [Salvia splendens]